MKHNAQERIIQELVPGKEITVAHLIASPDQDLFDNLGLGNKLAYSKAAIGIISMTPAETVIIAADVANKAAGVKLGFVDRVRGSLLFQGNVSEVETALQAICTYVEEKMDFSVCKITKT